ncbi:MAG: SDR family oxidoreductase [Pseudomonadota bacterium]
MSSHQSPLDSKSPTEGRKLALITGGTSGIGFGMAEALAPSYDLALSFATQKEKAQKAVSELREKFPEARIECYGVPLSGEKDCSELLEKVSADFQTDISVLVNSAGRLRDGLFMSQNISEHVALMEEHLLVPMILCHRVLKGMYRNQFGRIINLSSITARRFKMGQVNYSSAKSGIEGFTKSIAREVAHRGITVNAIAPGLIRTPMTEAMVSKLEEDRKGLRSRIPAGFVGEPKDIGSLAAFLCTPEARYITGQVIDVCGGRSLVGD